MLEVLRKKGVNKTILWINIPCSFDVVNLSHGGINA